MVGKKNTRKDSPRGRKTLKGFAAMLLALALIMGVVSQTAFAQQADAPANEPPVTEEIAVSQETIVAQENAAIEEAADIEQEPVTDDAVLADDDLTGQPGEVQPTVPSPQTQNIGIAQLADPLPPQLHFHSNWGDDNVDIHNPEYGRVFETAPVPSRHGYTFTGWYTSADDADAQNALALFDFTREIAFRGAKSLYAGWQPEARVLTYHANNGTSATVNVDTKYGEVLPVKPADTFTWDGYAFVGWSVEENATVEYHPTDPAASAWGTRITVADSLNLYAVWVPARTVTYTANGGVGSDITQTVPNGTTITVLPANTFTRVGHTFLGWSVDENITVEHHPDYPDQPYSHVEVSQGNTREINTDTTLYAVWAKNRTITYHNNDGTGQGGFGAQEIQNSYGGNAILDTMVVDGIKSAPLEEREGYTFIGWSFDPNDTVELHHDGVDTPNDPFDSADPPSKTLRINGDTDLYAVWMKNRTITYYINDGTGQDGNGASWVLNTYNGTAILDGDLVPVAQNTFSRTGYTFLGWTVDKNVTVDYHPDYPNQPEGIVVTYGATLPIDGDAVLYALWSVNEYTITYVDAMNVPKPEGKYPTTYTVQSANISLANLTYSGYNFLGWYKDAAYTQSAGNIAVPNGSTGNLTFYAKWEKAAPPPAEPPQEPPVEPPPQEPPVEPPPQEPPVEPPPQEPPVEPPTSVQLYSVRFMPGTHGTFAPRVIENISAGSATPAAPSTTGENGWIFTGWSPAVTSTVTQNVSYIAQWRAANVTSADDDDDSSAVSGSRSSSAPLPALPASTPQTTPVPQDITGDYTPASNNTPGDAVETDSDNSVISSNASPAEVLRALRDEHNVPVVEIGGMQIPLAGGSLSHMVWALVNLLLAILGVVFALLNILRALSRKNRGTHAEDVDTDEKRRRARFVCIAATAVLAVAGVVLFLLTQDITRLMVLVDRWTIVNAAIFAAEIAGTVFAFRRQKRKINQR